MPTPSISRSAPPRTRRAAPWDLQEVTRLTETLAESESESVKRNTESGLQEDNQSVEELLAFRASREGTFKVTLPLLVLVPNSLAMLLVLMQDLPNFPLDFLTNLEEFIKEPLRDTLDFLTSLVTGILDILKGMVELLDLFMATTGTPGTTGILKDMADFLDSLDIFTVILSPMGGRCRSFLEALMAESTRAGTTSAAPRGHLGAWTLQAILEHGHARSARDRISSTTPRYLRRNSARTLKIVMEEGPEEENNGEYLSVGIY